MSKLIKQLLVSLRGLAPAGTMAHRLGGCSLTTALLMARKSDLCCLQQATVDVIQAILREYCLHIKKPWTCKVRIL